ncbi:MAG TPA: hypothetical protein VHZ55_08005 [Bryobacteraceae bacterium]|nr:hypothetical protein [Bryobacteraceae bacterium]
MFSVVRAVLLKPLPYAQPDRLVRISIANPSHQYHDIGFSNVRFREMREHATSFSQLGAFFIATENMALADGTTPEQLTGARVTANFLDVLE